MKRFLAAAITTIAATAAGTFMAAAPALADTSTCGSASSGYVCTYVAGSGTWIDRVWGIRGKVAPVDICRSSVWAYYVPPTGGAYGLGYTSRNDCLYGRAAGVMTVGRRVPSGSRVCTKFMEFGQPVGDEPCVTLR